MSAIDIDRAIAAKATQGEWLACLREDMGRIADRQTTVVGVGKLGHFAATGMSNLDREDAEHIVRLHNRMPLYDALVDAVRVALVTGTPMDLPRNLGMVGAALADLDREQP